MSVTAEDLTQEQWLRSIWVLLQRVEQALLSQGNVTLPPVVVEPPDLADIVNAVTSLKPGPTAEEIAKALAQVMQAPVTENDEALTRVADNLEKLTQQLRGVNRAGGGGGGSMHVEKASNGTVTNPVAGTVEVLRANDARKGLYLWNLTNSTVYLKFGAGAGPESFSVIVDPDGYWEMPGMPVYTGTISAYWVAPEGEVPEGNLMVTELTQ